MKKIIPLDDYNMMVPHTDEWDWIGTARQTFSRNALRAAWKIIEYEEQ